MTKVPNTLFGHSKLELIGDLGFKTYQTPCGFWMTHGRKRRKA
jgi:hypothetical protein